MSFIRLTRWNGSQPLINLNQVIYIEEIPGGFAHLHLTDGTVLEVREKFYKIEKELGL